MDKELCIAATDRWRDLCTHNLVVSPYLKCILAMLLARTLNSLESQILFM